MQAGRRCAGKRPTVGRCDTWRDKSWLQASCGGWRAHRPLRTTARTRPPHVAGVSWCAEDDASGAKSASEAPKRSLADDDLALLTREPVILEGVPDIEGRTHAGRTAAVVGRHGRVGAGGPSHDHRRRHADKRCAANTVSAERPHLVSLSGATPRPHRHGRAVPAWWLQYR